MSTKNSTFCLALQLRQKNYKKIGEVINPHRLYRTIALLIFLLFQIVVRLGLLLRIRSNQKQKYFLLSGCNKKTCAAKANGKFCTIFGIQLATISPKLQPNLNIYKTFEKRLMNGHIITTVYPTLTQRLTRSLSVGFVCFSASFPTIG